MADSESSDSLAEAATHKGFRTPLLDNCDGYVDPPRYSSVQEKCIDSAGGSNDHGEVKIRTYWWRWNILIVFTLTLAANNVVWITAAPVADVMRCYYGISNTWVNAMTANYMATYVLFFFPAAWFLDRYGLRPTMIAATLMNAFGTSLRVIGADVGYYWLLLTGQVIASLCNLFIWGAGSHLSEVWFPPSERATSTAISAGIAPNLGMFVGLALGPFVIHRADTLSICGNETYTPSPSPALFADWRNTINYQMFYYLLAQAIFGFILLFWTLFAFPNAPPTPPSRSRDLEDRSEHAHARSVYQHMKEFALAAIKSTKNIHFMLFLLVSAVMITLAGTTVSVMNEVIIPYFPGHDEEISYLGMAVEGSAMISLLVFGRILDWTKAYYFLNVTVCVSSVFAVALISVMILYLKHFYLLYIGCVFLGASIASFQAVGYEYAVEMTYPDLPEGTSGGLVNFTSQILTFGMIFFVGAMSSNPKDAPYGLWSLVGITAFGAFIAVFVRPTLRRVGIDDKIINNNNMKPDKIKC